MNIFFAITFLIPIAFQKAGDAFENKQPIASFIRQFDTIKKFIVDDYLVTEEMLGKSAHSRKSGEITDGEGAWFTNDTLKQTLIFILYTDYHRLLIFHFLNDDIPLGIIKRLELSTDNFDPAPVELKQKYLKGFINQSERIGRSFFITKKKFRLGDSKEKALKVYGKPDKTSSENGVERYEWDFVGDILYDEKTKLKRNILVEDSFGHQTIMFFRNNKLIGVIFHNDIP